MKREEKELAVNELKGMLEKASIMVLSDYRGLTVEKITALRNRCRVSSATLRVVKNTLAKKAIPDTSFAGAAGFFEGPTAIALGMGDPVEVIKVLSGFSKENEIFRIKVGVMNGVVYTAVDLGRIATLPPRKVLLAQLAGSLNSLPVRMVGSLASPLRDLVGVLDAVRRSKEVH